MPLIKRMKPLLGTFVEIGVSKNAENIDSTFDAAFGVLEDIQSRLSFHSAVSEITRVNLRPFKKTEVSYHTIRLMRLSVLMMKASAGLFNPSMGKSLVDKGMLPDHGFGLRQYVGSEDFVEIGSRYLRLREPVIICFDGIGKGYAIDIAVRCLKNRGVSSGYINAGGDLRVFGDCQIPIQRPTEEQPVGIITDAAIATSTATACTSLPGQLQTSQGKLVNRNQQVSILASFAWRADALTKVALNANFGSSGNQQLITNLGGRLIV